MQVEIASCDHKGSQQQLKCAPWPQIRLAGCNQKGCQQQLKDANHDVLRGPGHADGRLKFAIRMLVAALRGGQQQLNYANHDGWLDPERDGAKGVVVRAPGLGVGG